MVIVEQMFLHPYMEYLDLNILNNSAIITIYIKKKNLYHKDIKRYILYLVNKIKLYVLSIP